MGSPPRGRGKGGVVFLASVSAGITPAWAGKSKMTRFPRNGNKDHPRVGGEKCIEVCPVVVLQGSPPRGRGKALLAECRHGVVGITPAWAGKRPQTAHRVKPQQDHPRVGGEKPYFAGVRAGPAGSPPRGRGKVRTRKCAASQHGITPAWAGKRAGQCWGLCSARDHPRVGGEKG